MNKSDLVDLISRKTNITTPMAQNIVNTIYESMKEAISSGGRVEIRGLGCFSVREYDGYTGRNPRSGESISIKPKKRLSFKAGKDISERITVRRS